MKRDSGTLIGGGSVGAETLRNGQRVVPIVGSDSMKGKRGTLSISQKLVSTNVGGSYSADIGTWRLLKATGTGAYKNLTGGGRFAAATIDGTVNSNQEGWVTIG